MHRLARYNREKVLDLLMERLMFEKKAVQLYEGIISRLRQGGSPPAMLFGTDIANIVSRLEEIRDQEEEHRLWLAECIRDLGGDSEADSELSRLITRESEGLTEIILDRNTDIPHLFHALMIVELIDNAGWDLLVDLADRADDEDAREEFETRLDEEEDHLEFIQLIMKDRLRSEILGESEAA